MSCLPRFPGLSLALLGFLAAVTPSLAQNAKLDAALSNSWWGHVPIMLAVEKGYFKEARHRRRGEGRSRARPTDPGGDLRLGRVQQSRPDRGDQRDGERQQDLLLLRQCRRQPGQRGMLGAARLRVVQGPEGQEGRRQHLGADHHERPARERGHGREGRAVRQPAGRRDGGRDRARRRRCGLRLGAAVHQREERRARRQAARHRHGHAELQEVRHHGVARHHDHLAQAGRRAARARAESSCRRSSRA